MLTKKVPPEVALLVKEKRRLQKIKKGRNVEGKRRTEINEQIEDLNQQIHLLKNGTDKKEPAKIKSIIAVTQNFGMVGSRAF